MWRCFGGVRFLDPDLHRFAELFDTNLHKSGLVVFATNQRLTYHAHRPFDLTEVAKNPERRGQLYQALKERLVHWVSFLVKSLQNFVRFKESAVVKQSYALSQPSIHRFNPNQSSNFKRTPQGRMTERDSQKHLVGLLHFFSRANRAARPKAAGRRRRPKRPRRARCRCQNRRELKWTERTK